jgi:LETM1-like protein
MMQVTLSLAMGINQYLPAAISPWVAEFQPTAWLQSQVDRIARVICKDDAMLIEEGHHLNECSALTEAELLDACSMRGLPIRTADRRRQYLTNHLTMVAAVRKDPLAKPDTDGFRLFTVHLTPLRHSLKKHV